MSEKDINTDIQSEKTEITKPYVNEKVKIYVIIAMIVLALISAAFVVFESRDDSEENNAVNMAETVQNI